MKGYRYIALLLIFILMFGGCSSKNSPDASDTDVPRITLSKDTSIEELLASMTLEEKVGQMVQGARDMLHQIGRAHV